ncbi:peptide deformylase [bacterium]|nr:peptide deformylase [bacterium]
MIYEIVKVPAKILRRQCKRITAADGMDLLALWQDMSETMQEAHGVGLAAPQIDKGIRFLVAHDVETGETHPFVNPEIVAVSEEEEVLSEGCLSIPGLRGDISRHLGIIMRFQDLEFRQHEAEFQGFFARVLQHEVDHLNGILISDRAINGMYEDTDDDDEEQADGAGQI